MSKPRATNKLRSGAIFAARELATISGDRILVPDPAQLVHLQLRRFAGCPVCNLHLHTMARRHQQIAAAGVREVVVFHSPEVELRAHAADLPFAVVADPEKRLYAELGAEAGARALLNPRAWWPIVRAILFSLWGMLRGRWPAPRPSSGRLGLPADFLIASDGRVLACKYGEHVDDQWSVDELLDLASASAAAADKSCCFDAHRVGPALLAPANVTTRADAPAVRSNARG